MFGGNAYVCHSLQNIICFSSMNYSEKCKSSDEIYTEHSVENVSKQLPVIDKLVSSTRIPTKEQSHLHFWKMARRARHLVTATRGCPRQRHLLKICYPNVYKFASISIAYFMSFFHISISSNLLDA